MCRLPIFLARHWNEFIFPHPLKWDWWEDVVVWCVFGARSHTLLRIRHQQTWDALLGSSVANETTLAHFQDKKKKKKALSRLRFTCYREVGGTGPLLASSCLWYPPGYSRSNQGLAQCGKLQNSLQTLLNLCLRKVPWQSGHLKSVCKAKCLLTVEAMDRERETQREM